MKHAYSFLAGAAMVSLTVFATRSLPGYMFLAGFIICVVSLVLLVRAIGASRLARFFSHLSQPNSIRLASHWSSDAKGVSDEEAHESFCQRTEVDSKVDPKTPEQAYKTARAKSSVRGVYGAGNRDKSVYTLKEIRMRRNPRSAQNGNSGSDVQSSNGNKDVLPQTQQDVLSALLNLKVSFSDAEQATRAAAKEHGGESFDTLFRTAVNLLNAGKSRRAAA